MATPEAIASQLVRLRATAWGSRLFRNNSGVLINPVGVPVRFGVANESAQINKLLKTGDFIGWTPVLITQEMVGNYVAVFTNVEAKAKGFKIRDSYRENTREFGQNNFNNIVTKAGGIAGFASDEQQLDDIFQAFNIEVTK